MYYVNVISIILLKNKYYAENTYHFYFFKHLARNYKTSDKIVILSLDHLIYIHHLHLVLFCLHNDIDFVVKN